MTLSQIIKLRTDNGRDIVDFLVDVMQDRFRDFRICHRLQAARLLATYGNEDAPNFIADNTSDTPTARRNGSKATRQTKTCPYSTTLPTVSCSGSSAGWPLPQICRSHRMSGGSVSPPWSRRWASTTRSTSFWG